MKDRLRNRRRKPDAINPSLLCDEKGCKERGWVDCFYPDTDYLSHGPDHRYCGKHAFDHGFCKGCGNFWGGVESFEFGNGFCDNCRSDPDMTGDYGDDDEGYEYEGDYEDEMEVV